MNSLLYGSMRNALDSTLQPAYKSGGFCGEECEVGVRGNELLCLGDQQFSSNRFRASTMSVRAGLNSSSISQCPRWSARTSIPS